MRRFQSGLSVFLIVVLGLAIIPKEYIHSLYGHEDDHCLPLSSSGIGKMHHHCKILQLIPIVFLYGGKQILPVLPTFSGKIFLVSYEEAILSPFIKSSPRAPPACS